MVCGVCGKKFLNEGQLICDNCHGRVKNDYNYCTKCGEVRKGKKKCKACGELFYNREKSGFRTKFSYEQVKGMMFSLLWIGLSVQSLLSDIFAERGIYIDGNYMSVAERRASIPIGIMMLLIGIVILIGDIKGKNNYR